MVEQVLAEFAGNVKLLQIVQQSFVVLVEFFHGDGVQALQVDVGECVTVGAQSIDAIGDVALCFIVWVGTIATKRVVVVEATIEELSEDVGENDEELLYVSFIR